jgi:propane monooxygenase reductase subunit
MAKHNIYFEPVGIEIEADEDEYILEESFRQGVMLMHGCKEGQCSACKAFVLEGDVEMDKYSTFALPEYESEEGYVLLCRAHAYSDLVIELTNWDEHMLESGVPIQTAETMVSEIGSLTHDIRRLVLKLIDPPEFSWITGQYVEITIPGTDETRSYSLSNVGTAVPAARDDELEFMIKLYQGGKMSALFMEGELKVGDRLQVTGPYGTFTLREDSERDMIFIGGGAGMGPLWALLNYMDAQGIDRKVTFYYGARTRKDLFYLDKLQELSERLPQFRFVPALSDAGPEDEWDGETGLITEVVDRLEGDLTGVEAYLCGPPPMVDAAIELLQRNGVSETDTFYDKFTTSVPLEEGEEVTAGPTKGPLDQILANLRARVETAKGEVEAAAEQVEEVTEVLESAQDAAPPFDEEAVQEDFQEAREALESAEEKLAGGEGEQPAREEGHSDR